MPKVGQYGFHLVRGTWRIYQVTCVYSNARCSGFGKTDVEEEGVYSIQDRESARRRVYELNGWNYRPSV